MREDRRRRSMIRVRFEGGVEREEDKGESRLNGVEQVFTHLWPFREATRVLSDTTRYVGGQVFQPAFPACETSSFSSRVDVT